MIFIVTHKDISLPKLNGYLPIQVGYSERNFSNCIRDNTNDNISEKNTNYCELTALYWIWKNRTDDQKGIVHYRRFFGKSSISNNYKKIYSEETLKAILTDYDIVLPKKTVYHVSAKEQLCMESCSLENFLLLRESFLQVDPKHIDFFDAFFSQNKVSQYNMLYSGKRLFDNYCAWLFEILFVFESKVNIDELEGYQKRLFGFISERLLNIWVEINHLNVFFSDVVQTENTIRQNLRLERRNYTNQLRFIAKNRLEKK